MTYDEAKSKAIAFRTIGFVLHIVAITSTLISYLKLIYSQSGAGSTLNAIVLNPAKAFVQLVFDYTQFLIFFWNHSPVPNLYVLLDINNIFFAIIFGVALIGILLSGLGRRLSRRLRIIDERIENDIIENSRRGQPTIPRERARQTTTIPTSVMYKNIYKDYLVPIIVGIFLLVFAKLFGL